MKKYKDFIYLIIFTMGTQAFMYYLIKLFISDYNILNSFMMVPLVKPFIYVYNSWYPFIILCAFLVYKYDKDNFKFLIITMLISAFISQITFVIYPSMVVRPEIEVNNLTDWILNFTYTMDSPAVNCFPSMHCIYCMVTSFYIINCKKIDYKARTLIIMYSLLIMLSTLFVNQHIIEDVILSLIYSIISILLVYFNKDRVVKLFNKIKKEINFQN